MNFKQPKIRSEKHRRFIASLPCCVSGVEGGTQAAHIRSYGESGMGLKSGDDKCVPLHWREHFKQHEWSESVFWAHYGGIERAIELAQTLYEHTGDHEYCSRAIREFRNGR